MFENRLFFTDKLVAMGARITLCDPHRAIVNGPSRLHGERLESPDIRAGMAMLIAALAAEGTSEIGNIVQIDRGYERIDERLRGLGARLERVATDRCRPPPERRRRRRWTSQPLPTGTRDVLAEEMRELRAIESALLELFASRGYEEVATPTIEYQDAFARGAGPEGTATYRFLDESGSVLALRNDMTVPIARLVARRFATEPGPFRLAYSGSVFRPVRPQRGQLREMRQIGVELIGSDAPAGPRS